MVRFCLALMLVVIALAAGRPARAEGLVVARVSLGAQEMRVFVDGVQLYTWPVSTAKAPKVTPQGIFTPEFLSRDHKSSRYDGAPMPWSVFYHGNYAIHGTTLIKALGQPASHGCVRLHPDNARTLFNMVRDRGLAATRVVIAP